MKISIKIAAILILLFSCDSVVENNDNESAEYTLTGLWVKDSVKAEYGEGCTEIGFHPGASLFSGSQEFYDLWSGCITHHNQDYNPECYNNYSNSTITESCFLINIEGGGLVQGEFSYNNLDSCSISKMLITDNNIYNYDRYIVDYFHNEEIAHIDPVWWSSNNIYTMPFSVGKMQISQTGVFQDTSLTTINFLSPDTLLITYQYDTSSFGNIEVDAPSFEFYLILDLSEDYLGVSRSFIHNGCNVKYTHSYSRDFITTSYDVMIVPDYQSGLNSDNWFSIDWGIPAGCGLLTTLDVFEGNPISINSASALPDVISWTQMDPPDFDLWIEESTPITFSIYNSYPVQDGCNLPENHLYLSGNNILYNSNIGIEQLRFNVTGAVITGGSGGDTESSNYTVFGAPPIW